jgi:hypothetical protein
MTRVMLDQATLEKLHHLKKPLEIVDESGRQLGRLLPMIDHSLYEGIEVPVSKKEIRRAEQESGGLTTAEVLAYLRRLETF